jgi:hypothetical protein
LLSSGSSGSNNEINEGSKVEFNSNLIENLVGYWTLNEADTLNGSVKDLSGNGNDGAIAVTPATFVADQNGVPNQAMSFDGSGDYVTLDNNITLDKDGSTVSLWFKANIASFDCLLGKNNYDNTGYIAIYNASDIFAFYAKDNANNFISAHQNIGDYDTNWHHLVFVYSSSPEVYLDGVMISTTMTQQQDIELNLIGNGRTAPLFPYAYKGSISDVAIYSSALTPQEVEQLYLAGKRKLPFENNFQNKSAVVNNTNNLPQY